MSRSLALLTIAAFALSGPLNARTLLAPGEMDEALTTTGVPADIAPPECSMESTNVAESAAATGGMPDTQTAAAGAEAQVCCWIYYMGRWWCYSC